MDIILHVQVATLIIVWFSIGAFIYAIRAGLVKLGLVVLGLLLLTNLAGFLTERVLTKANIIDFGLSISLINAWSIAIQLQLALTAAVAVILLIYNRKANGMNE